MTDRLDAISSTVYDVRERRTYVCAGCDREHYLQRRQAANSDGRPICWDCTPRGRDDVRHYLCTRCVRPRRQEEFPAARRTYGTPATVCTVCLEAEAAARRPTPRPCERCAGTFTPARSDARFCSGRCRVAAHRAKATA